MARSVHWLFMLVVFANFGEAAAETDCDKLIRENHELKNQNQELKARVALLKAALAAQSAPSTATGSVQGGVTPPTTSSLLADAAAPIWPNSSSTNARHLLQQTSCRPGETQYATSCGRGACDAGDRQVGVSCNGCGSICSTTLGIFTSEICCRKPAAVLCDAGELQYKTACGINFCTSGDRQVGATCDGCGITCVTWPIASGTSETCCGKPTLSPTRIPNENPTSVPISAPPSAPPAAKHSNCGLPSAAPADMYTTMEGVTDALHAWKRKGGSVALSLNLKVTLGRDDLLQAMVEVPVGVSVSIDGAGRRIVLSDFGFKVQNGRLCLHNVELTGGRNVPALIVLGQSAEVNASHVRISNCETYTELGELGAGLVSALDGCNPAKYFVNAVPQVVLATACSKLPTFFQQCCDPSKKLAKADVQLLGNFGAGTTLCSHRGSLVLSLPLSPERGLMVRSRAAADFWGVAAVVLDKGKLSMVFSHIYGNSVILAPGDDPLTQPRSDDIDFVAIYDIIVSFGISNFLGLSAGLLALSGESRLIDCTVHHNRVVLIQPAGSIRVKALLEGPYNLFAYGGGALFKAGLHTMQRCSVYENEAPDPGVANTQHMFTAGGIAVAGATVEMEQGVLSGNFGRGGGAAVRSAGALRLVGTIVNNNSCSLGFVGGSAGGVFVDGGVLAALNVTWAGNGVVQVSMPEDVLELRRAESASHFWTRSPFAPTFEQRTAHGFQYQFEARGCAFQQGALGLKGAALILGSELRDVTVTIASDGEQQFGACLFYNTTLASTVPSDKPHIIVRNSQFLDRSQVMPTVRLVACDPGGSQSFKTGTGAHCDRRARCEDGPAIVAGVNCTCAVPGSDQSDVSEFSDGTLCDQQSSARVFTESQFVNFVVYKPLDANVSFRLSARGDHEIRVWTILKGTANATGTGGGTTNQPSWLKTDPTFHNFSLSTAQNEMSVSGTAFISGSAVHFTDGSKLEATLTIMQQAADATREARARPTEQTLFLSGTVNALPSCEHVRGAAKLSHSSLTLLAHNDELSVAMLAFDADGLRIESTAVRFTVVAWYEGDSAKSSIDVVRDAINGSMYSARVQHSREGILHVAVSVHDAWDGASRSRVPKCESLDEQIEVRCALGYKKDRSAGECVPFNDEGSICSRSKLVVGSIPLATLRHVEVKSRIQLQLDPKDQNATSQYNLSLTPTECSEASPLSAGVVLNRPGKQKLQLIREGLDICTLVSELGVDCQTGEVEIDGICIKQVSCNNRTEIETDGRCIRPTATTSFPLDVLRSEVLKTAAGVNISSLSRPFTLELKASDRFNMSWRIRNDLPTWLKLGKQAGQANKDAIDVHLDVKGLADGLKLRASLVFEATVAAPCQEPCVMVEIGQLEVDSSVVAVPSPSRSVVRLRRRKRELDLGEPVEVGPGDAIDVLIAAVDEDGVPVRREDRSLALAFGLEGQGPLQVTASYSREEGVYLASLVVPDDPAEYKLWVESVFGFWLLDDSRTSGLPSQTNPITLIAVESLGTAKKAVTITISALFVLGLVGLLFFARKNRERLKEVFVSWISNEGLQGLQVANEAIDFSSDAFVYHTVVTSFRHLNTLFMAYTICFAVACLASSVGLMVKIKALVAQLRSRRLASGLNGEGADRATQLRVRLAQCRSGQMRTYAAVLTCILEDLPMGILAIFLASASDTKLSTFTQVCTAYSWINVGGKLLKLVGLKQQVAEEADIKRKLGKLLRDSSNATDSDADPAPLRVTRAGLWNCVKYSAAGRWLGSFANQKDTRRLCTDRELEFVRGVIIRDRQQRCTGVATAAAGEMDKWESFDGPA